MSSDKNKTTATLVASHAPGRIAINVGDAPEIEAFLAQRIYEYNALKTGCTDGETFTAVCRNNAGKIEAGVSGFTWGGCCFIANLWVSELLRGRGLGSELLGAAEEHARKMNCRLMLLSTHSFQAPGFYRRHGYEQIARVDDYPPGHADFLMTKRLSPQTRDG